ncbi:DNA cytosine methyltransferase [Streptomyces ruber]|uniref:Cytosine-specific methyltransferase n=2 Tax=Streptomyces TaxID=1883 RepID=A0A918BCV7_9ACTN|nr:DNA (cytosine-5-)-methyltransferase [Streptomyces ruber]GGQ54308.1 DNA cytosine methyltransferase [Streptomyces ruber]
MSASRSEGRLEVVEICAGAGGQSLGLHRAGFTHRLAVELDHQAAQTLDHNLRKLLKEDGVDLPDDHKLVAIGDVASPDTWNPDEYRNVELLAGGVPCPPFSIAGKQLGSSDERDLFAWAIELCGRMRPKALLLENVRGLSAKRFSGYRQAVLDKLHDYGYIATWKLLNASDFGVPQLRPRFVLVALLPEYAKHFDWPKGSGEAPTVGEVLRDLMSSNGWGDKEVEEWSAKANSIAPTIVGGSKKHGGADLGPTRAKKAWAALGVDAMGIANDAPDAGFAPTEGVPGPKLTTEMVARIQGWYGEEFEDWEFTGRKTSKYRQIGNAFPPPVAKALGEAIRDALLQKGDPKPLIENSSTVHDPVYSLLRLANRPLTVEQIIMKLAKSGVSMEQSEVERHLNHLGHDFELSKTERASGELVYSLGEFKAFVGQDDHQRHALFTQHQARIS